MTTTWAESLPTMTATQLAEVGAQLDKRGIVARRRVAISVEDKQSDIIPPRTMAEMIQASRAAVNQCTWMAMG